LPAKKNLRVLDIEEIESVPHVPMSHPFVERLIGSVRRELLDSTSATTDERSIAAVCSSYLWQLEIGIRQEKDGSYMGAGKTSMPLIRMGGSGSMFSADLQREMRQVYLTCQNQPTGQVRSVGICSSDPPAS
jgi:hypothetical protein